VPDAAHDERFSASPLVAGAARIRFYGGMPLLSPEGFPLGTLFVMDRKPRRLHHAQAAALRELARAVVELRVARDAGEADAGERWADRRLATALAAAYQEIWALGRAMSDSLHPPLDAITAHTAALLNDWPAALPAEARRLVFAIGARALDLDHMLEGLAKLAALSQLPAGLERFPLARVVNEAWAQLAPLRRDREVTLELGELPVVNGDPFLLGQALAALLDNALKFTRGQCPARIEVGAVREVGEFVCCVRDNGVGFDAARAKRLFEPFARLPEHAAFEGHGIGLALVERVLKRHGGRVWASGKARAGAEFFFALPSEG
jgi:signal transduction histidine kinase